MKKKKYEKKSVIIISIMISIFFEFFFFLFFFRKIDTYKTIQGIVSNQSILVYVNSEDKEKIYSNNYFYMNGKKIRYQIHDLGEIYSEKEESYYQIELLIKKQYPLNDVITISIKDKKLKLIEIFPIILEGD